MSNGLFDMDMDFTRTLPPALRDDINVMHYASLVAEELKKNVQLSRLNIIYARIDELDEVLLDVLAYDLHVDWYDDAAPIEAKRALVKNSVRVHKRLGTAFAVKQAVQDYHENWQMEVWHEYGGEPYYFRIILTDTGALDKEEFEQFIKVINTVKNVRSRLDRIIIKSTEHNELFVGSTLIRDTACVRIPPKLPGEMLVDKAELFTGTTLVRDYQKVRVPVRRLDSDRVVASAARFVGTGMFDYVRIRIPTAPLREIA